MTGHLPDHDASDPLETAVISGLVRSWPRRATVRRNETELDVPTMDDLYDDTRVDYPESLLPFAGTRTGSGSTRMSGPGSVRGGGGSPTTRTSSTSNRTS